MLPSALLLLTWSTVVAAQTQRIVEGPTDTRAISGLTVMLKCRVEGQKGAVQWVKGGFGLGYDRQLPASPRYTMDGSSAKGEFHLKIENVELSDDDEYQCQVGATVTDPVRKSTKAKLTVLVMPAPPRLVNLGESVRGVAGRMMTADCVSEGGKPPATIKWALARSGDGRDVVRWLNTEGTNPTTRSQELADGANSVLQSSYTTVNSSTKKEGAHFTDYISIPQDNPDLDFLPPPTYSTTHGYRSMNGYGPTNCGYGSPPMASGNGPMQYVIDHADVEYVTSPYDAFRPEPSYASFVSGPSATPVYTHDRGSYSNGPSLSMANDPGLYYPSDMAPLAPLETLQEMPTPETEAATPLLGAHSLHHGHSPMVHRRSGDDRRSPNDRPVSRTSTHV
uniref:Ig-like domain-containing protein n=1 Tax=Plectus sambesii TaxID=2011161 RepID=A0A914UYF9_9BILA